VGALRPYDQLKMQLETYGVKLVDIYGVISSQEGIEHALGTLMAWSINGSSIHLAKKDRILKPREQRRTTRHHLSRMIGAEVRYTRWDIGCAVRRMAFDSKSVR